MIDMKNIFLVLAFVAASAVASFGQTSKELWRQVEIIRTEYGVPHIRAENLRAAGYALAWVQCEDYGPSATPLSILQASGRRASVEGAEFVEADFFILRHRERTLKNYSVLSRNVREVYEGFAAGVNRYIELHRSEFPASMPADFTAMDVAATEIIAFSTR
jgi:acyl-homoserine-lactone acylase